MSHVFISYSRKNSDKAREIVDGLRSVGFVVWQDVSDIAGGANWQTSIQKGISDAEAVVVLWSAEASQSQWVQKEIQLAEVKGKSMIPIMLDDTPLSDDLTLKNGIRLNRGIEPLINALPASIRRRRLGFDLSQPMSAQTVTGVESWEINGNALMSVPLLKSSYCGASVVAAPGTIVNQTKAVYLCLQFSRAADKVFMSDVYRTFQASEKPEDTPPFVALHITGPLDYRSWHYLDNENSAHWIDAVDTTVEAVGELSRTLYPTLHLFAQAPNILTFALGMKFWRFWRVQLYNWIGGDGETRYQRVLDVLPQR